ncbi:MAG: glycosyltransferase family 9 protein, partial [Candidatus Sumerlaeota bacterium]|nr:glycosyltransferase family 9 protein [Candidatus Sumerlaeota bacterium]
VRLLRDRGRHELRALADLFSLAGPIAPLEPWTTRFLPEEEEAARQRLEELNPEGKPLVALHPGAGKEDKEWVWERWFELAAALEKGGARCVFATDDALLPRVQEEIARRRLEAAAVAPAIRPMALLLRACRLFISPDTGPRHLACAMGAATVTIFGNMDERRWGPFWEKDKHVVVRRCVWDLTPEELDGLPANHQCAMAGVEDVLAAAERWLARHI